MPPTANPLVPPIALTSISVSLGHPNVNSHLPYRNPYVVDLRSRKVSTKDAGMGAAAELLKKVTTKAVSSSKKNDVRPIGREYLTR